MSRAREHRTALLEKLQADARAALERHRTTLDDLAAGKLGASPALQRRAAALRARIDQARAREQAGTRFTNPWEG
jgi:hypothetical protein